MDSYLTRDELEEIHIKKLGKDVKISRRAVFYSPQNM